MVILIDKTTLHQSKLSKVKVNWKNNHLSFPYEWIFYPTHMKEG
jgi:hypothetical protein